MAARGWMWWGVVVAVFGVSGAAAAATKEEDPCVAPVNSIIAENCLPGSAMEEWDVNGGGSDDVVGFATRASYVAGEVVELKIWTRVDAAVEVEVYRLGWYGGSGARKISTTDTPEKKNWADRKIAVSQPACWDEGDVVDCGNWAVASRIELPRNATSGLYMARFTLPADASNWREDGSKTAYDPHHHMAGRDPSLPPEIGPHAYGAGGKFKLKNALTNPRASLAFFVVRSEQEEDFDMLVQTADATWHAYNGWGGLTTYGSFEFPWRHAPNRTYMAESEALDRAYKRSYNTPLITRDYRAVNAPFGAEYPAIRFLEKLGLNVHYISGADMATSRGPHALARSKAYLSVGHDEYWSYEQRRAVEDARKLKGVHLNFWSANEAYWAIRFEDSRFSEDDKKHDDDPPRTMVCYKETQSSVKLDPLDGAWTGTFRDARPINPRGAMPENALTGTMFAANAQRVDPLTVDPYRFGRHRFWADTSVSELSYSESFYSESSSESSQGDERTQPLKKRKVVAYPAGILGHEWDEPVDNGWQPAGLQKLSATVVDNVQAIVDWGSTFDSGTATHSLVAFRDTNSGAWTFGAGTVQWSWGLDPVHDVNDPQRANKYAIRLATDPLGPQPDLQQLTLNVFAAMGLKPPLLETNFPHLKRPRASYDLSPPAVVLDTATLDAGVLRAAGRAFDIGGGSVASVELAWPRNGENIRWFAADLDRVDTHVDWSFHWGHERWHRFHGHVPTDPAANVSLRASDDSGNIIEFHGKDATLQATPPMPSNDEL